jgi:hypothetical protein
MEGLRIQCGAVRCTVFRRPAKMAVEPWAIPWARWRVIQALNVAVWVLTATLMTSAVVKAVRLLAQLS